jgi:raffinose/stachyose/melibiose transport system substrate-binding protein
MMSLATAGTMTAALLAPCVSTGVASASAQKITLTFSLQEPNVKQQDPTSWDIAQAFMKKYPNIKIDIQGQVVATHDQDMEIAAQTHTLPDIFFILNAQAAQMAKAGDLLNVGPIVNSLNLAKSFLPNMLPTYKTGSDQYGLPQVSLVTGFYYNEAVLNRYHLQVPHTFPELLQVVKVLHSHNVATIEQGASQSYYSIWGFLTMLDRFGFQQNYKAILAGKGSYENKHFLALYTDIQTLAQDGAFNDNMTTLTYVQAVQAFMSGQAAFLDSGAWQASQIQASSIGNHVGFWAGPTFPNGVGDQKLFMDVPSAPLAFNGEDQKNPARYQALKDFIGFYYGPQGQKIFVKTKEIPVTKYVPPVGTTTGPVYKSILNEIHMPGWTSPSDQPDLVVSAQTASAMDNSLYGVMEGVYSPSAALKSVQETIKS